MAYVLSLDLVLGGVLVVADAVAVVTVVVSFLFLVEPMTMMMLVLVIGTMQRETITINVWRISGRWTWTLLIMQPC